MLARAAVRGWFNPMELGVGSMLRDGQAEAATKERCLQVLRRSCVVDPSNPLRWMLLDRHRRQALSTLPRDRLLELLIGAVAGGDLHARLMHAMIRKEFDSKRAESHALAIAGDAARWLKMAGIDAGVPPAEELAATLERRLRDDELDRLSRHMVGREPELARLASFFRSAWSAPGHLLPVCRVDGIGGVGKSTLIAAFMRSGIPHVESEAITLWIDYDRLRIRPSDVRSVLIEIARQLEWAESSWGAKLREFRRGAHLHTAESARNRRSPPLAQNLRTLSEMGEEEGPLPDSVDTRASADQLASTIFEVAKGPLKRPVLLVLDTLEQLERTDLMGVDLIQALDRLRRSALPSLAVLASGRSVFTKGFGYTEVDLQEWSLKGLSQREARHLLVTKERLTPADADKLMSAFADLDEEDFRDRVGIPMLLNLLGRLVREGKVRVDRADLESIRSAADAHMATAYLYERILAFVPPAVQPLASPGLVLREVSAELLREVIWPVVMPKAALTHEEAEVLFAQLSKETWLVEPVPGSSPHRVRHRPELRRAMLHKLYEAARPRELEQLFELNRRARDWHRRALNDSPFESAESRHHRLELVYYSLALAVVGERGADVRISDVRAVAKELEPLILDFPTEFRPVVRALLGGEAEPADIGRLPSRLRATVFSDRLRKLASRREYREAMSFAAGLSIEDRGRTPSLAWLITRCFLQSGAWETHADTMEPLFCGPNASALRFGKGRPSLLPFMAMFFDRRLRPSLRSALEAAPRSAGLHSAVIRRYELFDTLFAHLEGPSEATAARLRDIIFETVQPLRAKTLGGDAARIARFYGALELGRFGSILPPHGIWGQALRGSHACSIRGLMTLCRWEREPKTAAQFVIGCRKIDKDVAVGSERPLEREWRAIVFEDFHTPLGEALASALPDQQQAYDVAEALWLRWPERPHDLRPSRFGRDCFTERQRRERYKTLAAFADRAGLTADLLATAHHAAGDNSDLLRVTEGIMEWRQALGEDVPSPVLSQPVA
jgi:hypothetical protein